LCFGALALSQSTGIHSEIGMLFFGDNLRQKTVRFSDHAEEFNQIINAIGTIPPGGQEPQCILNEHRAVCDFQLKCRAIAIERDDVEGPSQIRNAQIDPLTHITFTPPVDMTINSRRSFLTPVSLDACFAARMTVLFKSDKELAASNKQTFTDTQSFSTLALKI
jgi:hypothetical protein